jgi:hypothetical protein
VVRATATGAALATVRPPSPDIAVTVVTAAADDRTFVLAAAELNEPDAALSPADYFTLRLDPAAGTARLTARLIVSEAPPHGPLLTANGEPTDGVLAVVAGSRFTPLRKGNVLPAW